jgi:hypothetical protein
MNLILQPVRVANGWDEEGLLVFDSEQRLVAVLTHLSETNEIAPTHWFLEAGFGCLDIAVCPTFVDLDAARAWISQRLVGMS